MKITKILKLLAIPLIGGFSYLYFVLAFASDVSGAEPAIGWYTAEMFMEIIAGLVVIELGAFYVRSLRNLRKVSMIGSLKKLTRNVVVTLFVGLLLNFLFWPLYSMTLAPDTLGVASLMMGQIWGLVWILQSFVVPLTTGPFVWYFTLSFVVLSLFDILRIRERNPSVSQRLDSSPVLR